MKRIFLLHHFSSVNLHNLILKNRKLLTAFVLTISTGLLIILANLSSSAVSIKSLPAPKPHPLPPTLTQWADKTNSDDYFSQVAKTEVGYLIWSQFPVRVYIEPPQEISNQQAEIWVKNVSQAVQEWNIYLPLSIVEKPEIADIKIFKKSPPLQLSPDKKIIRARSALTTYELYTSNNVLLHRFTILLSPNQTGNYLVASTRHELGHALGIWGHSPSQTDALYFSQVSNPPPISPRDVNTLKRVYQQPTSLGWGLMNTSNMN